MILQIHTDGACSGNQEKTNTGGWGAILQYGNHEKELFGGEENTTNNRMEMTALLMALKTIKKSNQEIEVYSDSSYLMECFRKKWYKKWIANGWLTSGKKPVENQDIWKELLPFLDKHQIKFCRVKGHLNLKHPAVNKEAHFAKFKEWNGIEKTMEDFLHAVAMNHRADALANRGLNEKRG